MSFLTRFVVLLHMNGVKAPLVYRGVARGRISLLRWLIW